MSHVKSLSCLLFKGQCTANAAYLGFKCKDAQIEHNLDKMTFIKSYKTNQNYIFLQWICAVKVADNTPILPVNQNPIHGLSNGEE